MKKIIIFLLISLLFITNVYAEGSVEIKSIDLDSKSETTTELNRPKFSGLEMNYDLRFKNVNDFAKYKIVIKNNTNKDYKVSEDTSFRVSDYVTYKYETSQTIKANSETTVNIIITYTSGVESSNYENGVFNESNKAVLELRDEEGNIVNPKTGSFNKVLILGVVAIVSTIALIFLMNKKSAFFVLVVFLVLSPVMLKATEELKVTMNIKVQISIRPTYKVSYVINNLLFKSSDNSVIIVPRIGSCSESFLYLNSLSEENKYNICSGGMMNDLVQYEEGDKVVIHKIEVNSYPELTDDEMQNPNVVEELENGSAILHNKLLSKVIVDKWIYNCGRGELMTFAGYDFDPQYDKTIMNFSNILMDMWSENSSLTVAANSTFTMPAHDVLFREQIIEANSDPILIE